MNTPRLTSWLSVAALTAGLLISPPLRAEDDISKMPEKTSAEISKSLGKKGVKIISAVYGNGGSFADVTEKVKFLLEKDEDFFANPQWLKVDPLPWYNKALVIIYKVKKDKTKHLFSTGENGGVNLKLLREAAAPKLKPQ